MLQKKMPKKMLIVGSGAIGNGVRIFLQCFWAEITIIEMLPQVLPIEDKENSDTVARNSRNSE